MYEDRNPLLDGLNILQRQCNFSQAEFLKLQKSDAVAILDAVLVHMENVSADSRAQLVQTVEEARNNMQNGADAR